jgi:type II secretory pathway component PulL
VKTGFIDWTDASLNFYVLDRKAGTFISSDASTLPLDAELTPETISSLPAAMCGEFILSIPSGMLTFRERTFPFAEEAKIRDTMSFELEGILMGSVSDYAFDHIIIESYEVSSRVLAVCIDKVRLRQIIDLFASAGLEPKVITSLDLRIADRNAETLMGQIEGNLHSRADIALREAAEPTINLRRNEFAYTGHIEKLLKRLRTTAALLLVFFLLIAGYSAFTLSSHKKEHSFLNREIEASYQKVFPEHKVLVDAGRQFKGLMHDLSKKERALGGIAILDMLRSIAENKRQTVTFSELSADEKNIIAKGTALSFEDVESLKNDLLSAFDNVKVTESEAGSDKRISFTIIMQEKRA